MNTQVLNSEKSTLLTAQKAILNSCQESKTKLTADQETSFANATNRINEIDVTLARMSAIEAGKKAVALPTSEAFVPKLTKSGKKQFSAEYLDAFWSMFGKRDFQNTANLNEGSSANGGYLVPVTVDGEIVPLAAYESAMRKLALVIPTTNDIKLPAQLSKTAAAAKSESTTIQNAFGGTAPTFTQVTLSAYMAGAVVPVSFELAQDVPALQAFLNADILRGIQNYEETKFINGSGSGEPMGILNGATSALTAALSASSSLDFI